MSRPVVTLLTDFGNRDPYVGIMKGQILSFCPDAQLVDLTHEVPAQDVRTASFHLQQSAPYFPSGTVHLAVVDPGVGSDRAMVAGSTRSGMMFVAPDNGILTRILRDLGPLQKCVRLPVPEGASSTFHGRDVMAPAAGRLAAGASLESLGGPNGLQVALDFPSALITPTQVQAWVLAVDHFGNVTFDLGEDEGREVFAPGTLWKLGEQEVVVGHTYADVEVGKPLLLWGSQRLLELAVRQGSAAQEFQLREDEPVLFRRA